MTVVVRHVWMALLKGPCCGCQIISSEPLFVSVYHILVSLRRGGGMAHVD